MPYETNEDLPDNVHTVLPAAAQIIFRKVYNSAWDEYEDPQKRRGHEPREEVANKVAWKRCEAAVRERRIQRQVEATRSLATHCLSARVA